MVMSGQASGADFVPVDAVYADDGVGYVQLTAGERLREARGKMNLSLKQAADQTRIRVDYLEALETMDARGLPARTYAIGYLRTLCGAGVHDMAIFHDDRLLGLYTATVQVNQGDVNERYRPVLRRSRRGEATAQETQKDEMAHGISSSLMAKRFDDSATVAVGHLKDVTVHAIILGQGIN